MNPHATEPTDSRFGLERPAPAHPAAGPAAPPAAPSGKSVASLVLGLLSLLGGLAVTGLPAAALGLWGLWDVRRGRARKGREGLAITGIATGLVGVLVVTPAVLYLLRLEMDESQSAANLRRIGAAIQSHSFNTGAMPLVAINDAADAPMLSWRVAILPYTGDPADKALYDQFHLDESWDGPHNAPLLARMPAMYALPGDRSAPPGYTYYRAFYDNGAAFDRRYHYGIAGGFSGGTQNTMLVVEASAPVPWTKPDDLLYMPQAPLPPLGRYPGGFQAVMADGSVRFFPMKTPQQELHKFINRLWNEPLPCGGDW
jgi:hypothetical protein